MQWNVETFPGVEDEIASLPPGLQGRMLQMLDRVEQVGLERMHEPHVKHLEGKLWELRVSAQEGIARGICVTMSGRRSSCCMSSARSPARHRRARWLLQAQDWKS